MISHRIRFKAIYRTSDAFLVLLWVAIPPEHIKRLEGKFLDLNIFNTVDKLLAQGSKFGRIAFLK